MSQSSELRQCPYNKSHTTVSHRFHIHLVKCRKANPHMNLIICPFNATHHVDDLQLHLEDCADSINFEVIQHESENVYEKYANAHQSAARWK